ncbi:PLP-dependent aminotransferase family protein [Fodinicola acaciae]|uniref:aminotransferase-like domain-containing protein n=1 Tax=Fodinicola acaciae TaxID=2681555 RepID=UPI0013D8570A|nr:PLP-dependent aminotransferase family protein [Fodinicola acaciae]
MNRDVDTAIALLAGWQSGRGPAYLRLARSLATQVHAGRLAAGSKLPTERALATALGVSRTTVVNAYAELRQEGVIASRQGAGTWVAESVPVARPDPPGPPYQREPAGSPQALCDFESGAGCADPEAAELIGDGDWLPDLRAATATRGYEPLGLADLRDAIASTYRDQGLPTTAEQIVVTGGAQQALHIVAAAVAEPGGLAGVQNPTYPGALDAFAAAGLMSVPLAAGPAIDGEILAYALRKQRLRLAYLIPTCHSPTGSVLPVAVRESVAEVAGAYGVPLIDDTTLAGLAFEDEPPVLASFAVDAPILTIGSVSKLAWPGLRIGWIRGSLPAVEMTKKAADLGTSVVSQLIALRLIDGLPAAKLRRRARLLESLDCVETLLRAHLPEWRWRRPDGGYLLWITLPTGDGAGFAAVARRFGVPVAPGWLSSPNNTYADRVRLCYAHPPDRLRAAIPRLAEAWRAYAGR